MVTTICLSLLLWWRGLLLLRGWGTAGLLLLLLLRVRRRRLHRLRVLELHGVLHQLLLRRCLRLRLGSRRLVSLLRRIVLTG